MKLENKVAIVTGAGSGMGKAIAGLFAKEGAKVIASDINETGVKDLIASSGDIAGEIVFSQTDVSNRNQVETMIDLAVNKYGKLDVLVNNAGICYYGLMSQMTEDQWNRIFDVNVKGIFHCVKAAMPSFLQNHRGCIINVSSMWGRTGSSCEAAYSATKGAVIALTKALAKELGPSGIRVNAVAPGVILTDMCANVDPEILNSMAEETPLERNGIPMDVARAMEYLVNADFVTGHVLNVDGGYVM